MGKIIAAIDDRLAGWIRQQHVFFVATAPSAESGFVNCSPKGGDTFRILGGNRVAYQDLTGSGVETIAHLRENRRIVVMFCAFEGPPRIVRLHGRGTVVTPAEDEYAALSAHFAPHVGTRAVIEVDVARISDSCGYAVPLLEFRGERNVLDKWSANKGEEKLAQYRRSNNAVSIDGLPGLDPGN